MYVVPHGCGIKRSGCVTARRVNGSNRTDVQAPRIRALWRYCLLRIRALGVFQALRKEPDQFLSNLGDVADKDGCVSRSAL